MKLALVVWFVGLCVVAFCSPTNEEYYKGQYKTVPADKTLIEKQRRILSLYRRINQPDYDFDNGNIYKEFKLDSSQYTKPEVVQKIKQFYENNYQLPKKAIFSMSYPEHLEQAIAIFDLFYYAKDFDTFYKTAVVSRKWLNEAMFLYTYSLAVIHREDCYGITLPPLYEIYPYYFFNAETIQKAYQYKQTWTGDLPQSASGKYHGYTIISNYTGYYMNLHPEQALSYYLEDVEINYAYYMYNLYYPWWMDGEKYDLKNDRRGELYYFTYQQLLCRYYLERLSNGMGQIPLLDMESPIETPYYPSLQYPNGLPFPERPRFARLSDYFYSYGQRSRFQYLYSYQYYKDYTRRIADAIDRGFAMTRHGERKELYNEKFGTDILGNLIQSNPDSPDNRFYGPWLGVARRLLGYSFNPISSVKVAPSALEHAETSLRDPVFYQLYKLMISFYARYQTYLEPYTKDQLSWKGVEIKNMEIDRLITYFDEFYSDISQAVYYTEDELKKDNDFMVRVKQYRLNHKPFTYKINLNSEIEKKAIVKVFIGPKYDEYGRYINISENRWNFFEIDKFVYDLTTGENTIKRSSLESRFFSDEKTSFYKLYKDVMAAYKGQKDYTIDGRQNYFLYPRRYMLPKGTTGGLPVQICVMLYPYEPYTGNKPEEWTYGYPRPGVGGPYLDQYSLYYPFDRPIRYDGLFYTIPNMYFYETKVYNKKDINSVTYED
ncbi:hypothetical protein GWI33_018904 [Rhynchophorus ferrugineus]|uniref:Uncharacterized protein n=1 Tax=Rhynchophorus ferrugineus TaxID=354439 RepID=A0A834HWY5_RHYFE|nr:hypothetical protein GWI33_018904 [Rhynchophorus ferrugineus]